MHVWGIIGFVFTFLGLIFTFLGIISTAVTATASVGISFALPGILFLFGGGAILYYSYQKAQKTIRVLREGEAVQGQIVSLEQNVNVRINMRYPWVISYRFKVNGREYQGNVTTLNTPTAGVQPGKIIYVLYLQNTPEDNVLYPHP
jgi:hypothetical protein